MSLVAEMQMRCVQMPSLDAIQGIFNAKAIVLIQDS